MKSFFKKNIIYNHSFLKKSLNFQKENPFFLTNLFHTINEINLKLKDKSLIFGFFKTINFNTSVKQKLLFEIFSGDYRIEIILSKLYKKKINKFLIKEWLKSIEEAGLTYSKFLNFFYLFFNIISEIGKSLVFCIKTLFEKKNLINKLSDEKEGFLQVNDADFEKLFDEKKKIEKKNYTFVDWMIEKYDQKIVFTNSKRNRTLFYNGREIIFSKNNFPSLNFFGRIQFLMCYLVLIIESTFRLFKGDYHLLLVFFELSKSLKVHLTKKDSLAKKYFYSQSSYICRPMWSYYTNNHSEFILFFYSCAFDGYKFLKKYPKPEIGLEKMSWDKVMLWSELHKQLLEKQCKDTNFNLVSPIYYIDNIEKEVEDENYLAVFDLVPYRPFFEASFYQNHNFYISYLNLRKYLEDIIEVTAEKRILIGFKPSKNILNGDKAKFDQRYKYFLKKNINNRFKFYSNDISPYKLIEKSKCVISYPWTSTAVIAKKMGKPSIFYDPTSKLSIDDRGKHDIKFIQNKNELKSYINNIFEK